MLIKCIDNKKKGNRKGLLSLTINKVYDTIDDEEDKDYLVKNDCNMFSVYDKKRFEIVH